MILSQIEKKERKKVMFPNLHNSIILYLLFLNPLSLEIIIFVTRDLYEFVIT